MTNIEETLPVGPSLPPQKALETKSGGITEKVGREHLISGPTKAPSIEQAQVSSTTFELFFLNKVETLATFPMQQLEAVRLGARLEKDLRAFEKGKPFHVISKTGEAITIQPGEKTSFVQNFLLLLSSLLNKSESNTQLKSFFYDLLTRFVKSTAFCVSQPDWENLLQRQREVLSKEKRSLASLEQAFQEKPSLDTLAQLFISSPSAQPG